MVNMPNWFVVCMGVGTVFVGLICIVILCKLMSLVCRIGQRSDAMPPAAAPATAPAPDTANRQEIIAAVAAVAAEELGTDISAIRIHSFKKL